VTGVANQVSSSQSDGHVDNFVAKLGAKHRCKKVESNLTAFFDRKNGFFVSKWLNEK
jgi:hypothetical protein